MKTSVIPQVRVEPELRAELEAMLRSGETLSEFVEASVRNAVEYRRIQAEFHARGEAAWQAYARTGESYAAADVVGEMREMLKARRRQLRSGDGQAG